MSRIRLLCRSISLISLFFNPTFANPATNQSPSNLLDDKDIIHAAIKTYPQALQFASPRLKKDRDIVLTAVSRLIGRNPERTIIYADKSRQQDREIAIAAVSTTGFALQYLDPLFQRDKEVVKTAISLGKLVDYPTEVS